MTLFRSTRYADTWKKHTHTCRHSLTVFCLTIILSLLFTDISHGKDQPPSKHLPCDHAYNIPTPHNNHTPNNHDCPSNYASALISQQTENFSHSQNIVKASAAAVLPFTAHVAASGTLSKHLYFLNKLVTKFHKIVKNPVFYYLGGSIIGSAYLAKKALSIQNNNTIESYFSNDITTSFAHSLPSNDQPQSPLIENININHHDPSIPPSGKPVPLAVSKKAASENKHQTNHHSQDDILQQLKELNLSEQYYDRHINQLHPELKILLTRFLNIKNKQEVQRLITPLLSKHHIIKDEHKISSWDVEKIHLFIKNQLTSYKELHLFLKTTFHTKQTSLEPLSRYYGENPSTLASRIEYIKLLSRTFDISTPNRLPPLVHKFKSSNEFIDIFQKLSDEDIKNRLSKIKIRNKYLFNQNFLINLEKKHILQFLKTIHFQEKRSFISRILVLNDTVPNLLPASLDNDETVAIKLKQFVARANKLEKEYQFYQYVSSENLRLSDLLRDDTLINKLSHSQIIEKSKIYHITINTVEDFIHNHLHDHLSKAVFLIYTLNYREIDIFHFNEYWQISIPDVLQKKEEVRKKFVHFIDNKHSKTTKHDSTIEKTTLKFDDQKKQDLFSKNLYYTLNEDAVIERLANSHIMDSNNFLNDITINTLNKFVLNNIVNPHDWYIFYVFFLEIEKKNELEASQDLGVVKSTITQRKYAFKKILNDIAMKDGDTSDQSAFFVTPYTAGRLGYTELESLYHEIEKNDFYIIVDRISSFLIENIGENKKLYNRISKNTISMYLNTALDSQLKRHFFFTIMLKLDQSKIADIVKLYNINYNNITSIKRGLIRKLVKLLSYEISHLHKSTNLSELKKYYSRMSYSNIADKIKNNILEHSKKNKEEFKTALDKMKKHHIRYFTQNNLGKNEIKWMLYLSRIININQVTSSEIAKLYNKNKQYIDTMLFATISQLINIINKDDINAHHLFKSTDLSKLKKYYSGMSFSRIKNKIMTNVIASSRENKEDLTAILNKMKQDHLHYFVQYKLQDNDIKWMVYLSRIININQVTSSEIAKLYNKDNYYIGGMFKYMTNSLTNIISKGDESTLDFLPSSTPEDSRHLHTSIIPHDLNTEDINIEALKDQYLSLDNRTIIESIKKNLIYNSRQNTDQLSITLNQMTQDHIIQFEESVLKKNQLKWMIYFSKFVGTVRASNKDIAKKYNKKDTHIAITSYEMRNSLSKIIAGSFRKKKPLANNSGVYIFKLTDLLSITKLWEKYDSLPDKEIFKRLDQYSHDYTSLQKYLHLHNPSQVSQAIRHAFLDHETYSRDHLKQKVFLSLILKLDNYSPQMIIDHYSLPDTFYLKNIEATIRNHLQNTLYQLQDEQNDIEALDLAKATYKTMSNDDILFKVKNSFIFESKDELRDKLTVGVINKFIDTQLNNQSDLNISLQMWRLFLFVSLELPHINQESYEREDIKQKVTEAMIGLLEPETHYDENTTEQPISNAFFTKHRNTFSYFGDGYLDSDEEDSSIYYLKNQYVSLDDQSIIDTFQNSDILASKFDTSSITLNHIDIFLSSLKEHYDWRVFFCSIISTEILSSCLNLNETNVIDNNNDYFINHRDNLILKLEKIVSF
ncbi:MAG: hypothetical protein OXC44_06395 [Proteobacteria bacterium]|nr:hypothetical protein [Pseudomonadota bacterium]